MVNVSICPFPAAGFQGISAFEGVEVVETSRCPNGSEGHRSIAASRIYFPSEPRVPGLSRSEVSADFSRDPDLAMFLLLVCKSGATHGEIMCRLGLWPETRYRDEEPAECNQPRQKYGKPVSELFKKRLEERNAEKAHEKPCEQKEEICRQSTSAQGHSKMQDCRNQKMWPTNAYALRDPM